MTREELLERICYSDYMHECNSLDGRYHCQDCKDAINSLLDEYDKKIRTDVIDEVLKLADCENVECWDCTFGSAEVVCKLQKLKEKKDKQ